MSQLLLKKNEVDSSWTDMNTVSNAYTRVISMINICLSVRSLYEIFYQYEPSSSDLISNRIDFYKAKVGNDLELLREVHNSLLKANHDYTSAHLDLLNNPANLQMWEMSDSNNLISNVSSTSISFNIGLSNFIAEVTDVSGLSKNTLLNGSNSPYLDSSTMENMKRLEYYIMQNGEGQLRQIAENSSNYFLLETVNSISGAQVLLYVLSCLGTGCVFLIVLFFCALYNEGTKEHFACF